MASRRSQRVAVPSASAWEVAKPSMPPSLSAPPAGHGTKRGRGAVTSATSPIVIE